MATVELQQIITIEAGADLSAAQFTFMVIAADGQIDQVGSAGADADGVLMNDPSAAGEAAELQVGGVAKVVAGGTVAAGAKVQSDAAGEAILAASGDHVLGKAITGGADGEVISVLLKSTHILA